MQWTIYIDPAVNCAFGYYSGKFDIEQLGIAAEEMFNHPDYREGMNSLRDARDVTLSSETPFAALSDEAKRIMAEFDKKLGECKWALVVKGGQHYATAHKYLLAGRLNKSLVERETFQDIEKAREWLGIPKDYKIKEPALK